MANHWKQKAAEDIEERGTEGSFRRIARRMGMSTKAAASRIMANKDRYSPAVVKKANLARNFSR